MKKKTDTLFWPSYSDLMTSLFFIMLVLFALSFFLYRGKIREQEQIEQELRVTISKAKKINEIDRAIKQLDPRYFYYNEECKRHELVQDVTFGTDSFTIPKSKEGELIKAGKALMQIINNIDPADSVKYVLIIEGRAARHFEEEKNMKYAPWVRHLSYSRAKALNDFWMNNGIHFNEDICEVIVAGSGFEGQCRYTGKDEGKNKNFIIQIIPKTGIILQEQEELSDTIK